MVFGIDYSRGRPNYDALKRAGVAFVMRYVSHDASKDLDAVELARLRRAGIGVGLVFESGGKRALDGYGAGRQDALWANQRVQALGLPATLPVYFAVDFDARDRDKPAIRQYLYAAASVLGPERVGVYGGYWVVKDAAEHNAAWWFWQTYAWSGGQRHPAAHIYQYSNGHALAGIACDYNRALRPEIGVTALPDPSTIPWWTKYGPRQKPRWFFAALRDYQRRLKLKKGQA